MHRIGMLILMAMCAMPLCAQTTQQSTQQPTPAFKGYKVEIDGAGSLSKLLDENLEIRRHESDANLNEQEFHRLADITPDQIRELLATEGYFSPDVKGEVDMSQTPPVARFHVERGEPVKVGNVEIRFKGDVAKDENKQRMNRLRRQWELESDEIFKQSAWADAKNNLLKNFLLRDYPAAKITDSEARVDPARRIADLSVEIDSGPAFTFGELDIHGLQRYSQQFVERLNPIQPGERFSQEKLNDLQSRLQNTGYFLSAFVTIDPNPEHPQNVPIHLELTENPLKKLSFGIGFSTDGGPRLEAHWMHRDFLDRDWRLETDLQFDQKTRRAGVGLFLPALEGEWLNGWLPSYDVHFERKDIAGEVEDEMRVGARVSSPDKRDEKVWGVAYYGDHQYLPDYSNTRHAVLGSFTYTKRRLDDIISPRRGYVASMELGVGMSGIDLNSSFGRVLASVHWLSPYYKRWQLVMRGQYGQVFGSTRFNIPGDLLFRTGGDQTVRGYSLDTLGIPEDGAIVEGKLFAVASAEIVYHLTPQWGVAVFTDIGNATDSWRDFKFDRGTGAGIRWHSPIGPINLDLAYGEQSRSFRIHFSVGYGF
jgi:translocation and assembly module TamA